MKLLVIPSWYPSTTTSYEGIFIKEQAKALQEAGMDVSILYGDYQYRHLLKKNKRSFQFESKLATFRGSGFFVPKVNNWLIEKWAKAHLPLFEDYLKKYGPPELLHAHSYMAGAIAFQIAKQYHIPYVLTEHLFRFLTGDVRKRHQELVRKVYDGASALIAVSSALQKGMQGYTNTEIELLPNLVDTQYFKAAASSEKSAPNTFISVGNLNGSKAYDVLINAFKVFKTQEQGNSILKIIGDGPLKKVLEKQIAKLALTQEVFLLGALSPQGVLEELQKAHCFVSSSRVETFGVAIVEALAVGLPVIATKCGGPEEIIKEGIGQLVPINDEEALAQAMRTMALDKYDSKKIRQYVELEFSKKVIANKLIAFYKRVIGNN